MSNDIVDFFLKDIRDLTSLIDITKGVDIIIHAAAFKHVIMCEKAPEQALQTNILGTENVIKSAKYCGVEMVIFTSSDKAVNPTNVMGASKLMGERLITAANSSRNSKEPLFYSTRFGNVLGSNGSVVSVFKNQISKGGPVTLTDGHMTRFIMSISDSAELVLDSSEMAIGGEVLVTKMPTLRIKDLAEAMIQELAPIYNLNKNQIDIIEVGAKAGEKMYEELLNEEEIRRTIELNNYYSVLPAFNFKKSEAKYENITNIFINNPYNSNNEKPMSILEIRSFLNSNKILMA